MFDDVERVRKMLAMGDAGYGTIISHEDVGRLLKECDRRRVDLAEAERKLAERQDDYLRRHNDAVDHFEKWKMEEVRAERAEADLAELREQLHYANGTCDLAMQHRNKAEADLAAAREILQDIVKTDDRAMAEMRALGMEVEKETRALTDRARALLAEDRG